jgi:hypothetical protein
LARPLHKAERGWFYADKPCTFRSRTLPPLTEADARSLVPWEERLGHPFRLNHCPCMPWHGVAWLISSGVSRSQKTLPPFRLLKASIARGSISTSPLSRLPSEALSFPPKLQEAPVVFCAANVVGLIRDLFPAPPKHFHRVRKRTPTPFNLIWRRVLPRTAQHTASFLLLWTIQREELPSWSNWSSAGNLNWPNLLYPNVAGRFSTNQLSAA